MTKLKSVFLFTILVASTFFLTEKTQAATGIRKEAEPNNSYEQADTISRHSVSIGEAINTDYSNRYIVEGKTSTSDDDWYVIFLTAGENYLSFNGKDLNFTVYKLENNEFQTYIRETTYQQKKDDDSDGFIDPTAYDLTVSESGYYYIKVTGVYPTSENYKIFVGNPAYELDSYKYSSDSFTLNSSQTYTDTVDLTNISGIPDNAIVYRMEFSYVTEMGSILIKNENSPSISADTYTWKAAIPPSYNYMLDSTWYVTYKNGTRTKTYTPRIKICYVYPVLP